MTFLKGNRSVADLRSRLKGSGIRQSKSGYGWSSGTVKESSKSESGSRA